MHDLRRSSLNPCTHLVDRKRIVKLGREGVLKGKAVVGADDGEVQPAAAAAAVAATVFSCCLQAPREW
jgi:hypothetical protein